MRVWDGLVFDSLMSVGTIDCLALTSVDTRECWVLAGVGTNKYWP